MRATIRHFLVVFATSLSCYLLMQGSSLAVVIQANNSFASPPAVIGGDLLETSATLTFQSGTFVHEGGLGPSALNDGVFNPAQAGVTTPSTGSVLEYTFDTSSFGAGYNITSIVSSGGWADEGRDRQDITISYTTVDNPTLQLLTNISFDPSPGNYSSVALTDSTGTLITGLKTLQLVFPNQENTYAGYGEFDVIGTGILIPIPEPSTAALLGLGACGLYASRRRKRTIVRTAD